jgi:drug/metabolite transporter (DMT)-like permease
LEHADMAESLVDPEPQPAPNPRSTRIWGYAFGALGAALFATKAIFIKLAYAKGLDAETFLALRMLFATPIYLAVGVWAWRRRARSAAPIERPALLRAAGIGVLGY